MNEFKYGVGQSVWTSTQMMRKIEDRRVNCGVNEYLFVGAVWVGEEALDFVQGRVALAAREAEEERLRDVKLQRVAEGMSRWCEPQSPHLAAIADALEHAKRKHPFFAQRLFRFGRLEDCSDYLYSFRRELEHEKRTNSTCAKTILTCEALEAEEAFMQGDYKHTLEELAQCGAVIVRMMEAVQALVDEVAQAGKEAK